MRVCHLALFLHAITRDVMLIAFVFERWMLIHATQFGRERTAVIKATMQRRVDGFAHAALNIRNRTFRARVGNRHGGNQRFGVRMKRVR